LEYWKTLERRKFEYYATTLQKYIRRNYSIRTLTRLREEYERRIKCSVTLQSYIRRLIALSERDRLYREELERKNQKAIILQKYIRSFIKIQDFVNLKIRLNEAYKLECYIKCQVYIRRYQAALKLDHLNKFKQSTIVIQRYTRTLNGWNIKEKLREEAEFQRKRQEELIKLEKLRIEAEERSRREQEEKELKKLREQEEKQLKKLRKEKEDKRLRELEMQSRQKEEEKIMQLEKELQILQNQTESLKKQNEENQQKHSAEYNQLKEQLLQLRRVDDENILEIKRKEEIIKLKEEQLKYKEEELSKSKELLRTAEESRKTEAEKLKELKKEFSNLSKKHTEEMKSLEQKLKRKNDKRRKLTEEVKALGEVIRTLREQQEESKRKDDIHKNKIQQKDEIGSRIDDERKLLSDRCARFEDCLTRQETILTDLQSRMQSLETSQISYNQRDRYELPLNNNNNRNLNSLITENQIRLSWGVYTGGLGLGFGSVLVGVATLFKTLFPDGIQKL